MVLHRVDTAEFHQFKGGKAGARDSDALLLDTDVLEIVPLSEMHVKIKSGLVEGVELPKNVGLTAKVKGDDVTISASKDAKEGTHQITVRGSKGKKATIQVHLKAANPVTGPKTSEHHSALQVPMGGAARTPAPGAATSAGKPAGFPD